MPLLVVVAGNTVLYSIPNQRMAATLRNACRPDVLTLSFGASTLERGPTTPVAFQQPQHEAASRVVRVVKKLQKNRLHAVFYIDEESDLYSDTKLGKRLEELGVTTSQPNWYSTLPPGVDTDEGGLRIYQEPPRPPVRRADREWARADLPRRHLEPGVRDV